MTVEEIFGKIATHMVEGLMFHSQMAEYYQFLGLDGYSQCHEYHFLCESKSYQKIMIDFITYFNKLLPSMQANDPKVIPNSWYKYVRSDVDMSTKRSSVKTSLEKWVAWEKDTQSLYQQMYKELINIGEIAAANRVLDLVKDVTEELHSAEQYLLNKKGTEYDMVDIIEEQHKKKEDYEIKCRSLFLS